MTSRRHDARMLNRNNTSGMISLLFLLEFLLKSIAVAAAGGGGGGGAAAAAARRKASSSFGATAPGEAIVGVMMNSPITTGTPPYTMRGTHQHYDNMRAAEVQHDPSSLPSAFAPPRSFRRRTATTGATTSSAATYSLLFDPNISPPERAFDYYDVLRRTSYSASNANATARYNITQPSSSLEATGNSQIYAVHGMTVTTTPPTSSRSNSSASNTEASTPTLYRMAEIKAFLPFSNATHIRDGGATINDAFTVLLAIYHFNNFVASLDADAMMITPYSSLSQQHDNDDNATVVGDLQDCNVRLTTELVDTRYSPIETTRTFSSMLQRPASAFHEYPPPTAVVGALRSAVSSPLAILTGVSNITQVSHGSTALDFDTKEQFPVFGRTVTSTVGEAAVAVSFFQSIAKTQYVAIIFVTDAYGSALQKSFQDAASAAGIQTESIAISFDLKVNSEEARNAMQQLKQTQYRHVYGIFFEEQIEALMTAATEYGVVGPDYFYLFNKLLRSQYETLNAKSANIPLYHGAAIIQMQGGVLISTNNTNKNGNDEHDIANSAAEDTIEHQDDEESSSGFERFMASWTQALNDPGFVQHVRNKLPSTLDSMIGFDRQNSEFYTTPKELLPFLYDAVFTLGLSMCRAGMTVEFFNASDIFEQFRQLDVHGASGRVKIDPKTGTRDYRTMSLVIWNSQVIMDDGLDDENESQVVVEYYPTFRFHNGEWITIPGSRSMVYADGSEIPPDALPPVEMNYNYIGKSGRIVGYLLMSVTIFTALVSLVWLVWNRHEHVVRAAQPLFLALVSIGSIVTSSTILPMSMEETTVAYGEHGLDMACMAAPWLYFLGMNIAFSALFAKTVSVHQAYMNPTLDFIIVSMRDIFVTAAILLTPNVIVLLTWTIRSPMEWTRVQQSTTDMFGRHTESFGECSSEDAYIYAIVICAINFVFLMLGNWAVYQSRNIETEYNESRYVAVSLFAVLQAWCMGIPILAVTYDNPQGRFYVMCGIIFVTAQSILSLVYIPKMLNLRQARKIAQKQEDPKRKAYAAYASRRPGREEEQDESEMPSGGDDIPDMSSSNPVSSIAARPALASGMSSRRSMGARPGSSLDGIKVIHNPKSSRNLQLSGGIEMSREQLDFLVANGTGESIHPTMVQEAGTENATINMSTAVLSKLDKTTDQTHTECKNEQGGAGEGNSSSIGIANSEDAQQQQVLLDDETAAPAQRLPLQDVDEENHAAALIQEEEEEEEESDSSPPTPTDDKVKGNTEEEDEEEEEEDEAAAHFTAFVLSDDVDEGGDTEDTVATTAI